MQYALVFDGGCDPNPGNGYGSYCVREPGGKSHVHRMTFGPACTNNIAEYKALIAGMEAILAQIEEDGQNPKGCELIIRGDSRLVINQVTGTWRALQPHLIELNKEAKGFLRHFGKIDIKWHPRNRSVDILGH